jgi:GH43 family beta-xylosidase
MNRIALCLAPIAGAQTAPAEDLKPLNFGTVAEKHLWVPMRDGVRLSAYAYFPAGTGRWPVLFQHRLNSVTKDGARRLTARLAEKGFVVVNVIRSTERELMPRRGAKLGNFGIAEVNANETWMTDAEWMQTKPPNFADFIECMKYGSDNAVFAARIQWRTPNKTWNQR